MDYTDLFSATSHDEGSEVQLIGMDLKPVDMYLTISGVDSKVWRAAKSAMERTAMLNFDLPEAAQINIDPSEATANALAKCVKGWRGFTVDGEDVEFSIKLVKELFIEAPYLMDHVDKFFSNRANFTKGKASE